jgi:hypothetical protein
MPIARFATFLRGAGQWKNIIKLLLDNFNPAAIDGLMCRRTLNIGWQGEVYDCDFNQMLKLAWHDDAPLKLWDVDWRTIEQRSIATGLHCFGCTAAPVRVVAVPWSSRWLLVKPFLKYFGGEIMPQDMNLPEEIAQHRIADYEIDPILLKRWSPRAFSPEPIE